MLRWSPALGPERAGGDLGWILPPSRDIRGRQSVFPKEELS